jgi:ATP-dependent Clp protease ATP-binding subunit ClpC
MFEFTKRSRKVLEVLAQAEGKRLNSESLGPEHILIALIGDEDSVASRIIANLSINFDRLRSDIEKALLRTNTSIIIGRIPVSQRFKKIIDLSKEEAKKLKNSYIGTEHLLLAIFKDGTCMGIEALQSNGIDYNVIKNEIMRVLGVKVASEKPDKADAAVKHKAIEEFANDLTSLATLNLLDPVIGRKMEVDRTIRILSRKRKNNPILIGEAGVGKTAIVEGLAQRIIKNEVPESLKGYKVLSIDLAGIVAGTKYRGEFEERLKNLVREIKEEKNIIIFIDEIHTLIGAGAAEGAIDAANILKPALARGELQCIGATTLNEFKQHFEKDSALVRRFQTVYVDEPDMNETIQILKGLRPAYEKHHRVLFNDDAIEKAVYLADRYINDRFLPDKAIDLMDEAGAMARLENILKPIDIISLEDELEALNKNKNELVMLQEYEQAAAVRDQLRDRKLVLESKLSNWHERKNEYAVIIGPEKIAEIISETTGIPVKNIKESESEKLLNMENEIHSRVIGQDEAVNAICRAIKRSRMGLSRPDKPRGSFVFLGPSGVGKTQLAKTLAFYLFEDEKSLIRLDMSEYMEKHSVSRIIGSPPGYIGYEEGGQLTEKIRRRPYAVILFDEIEKAHPDVLNILLQVLEEGELSDSSGITVSFRDTIIIMTSNLGNDDFHKTGRLGFGSPDVEIMEKDNVLAELKKFLRPEFINRIDETVVFHRLDKKQISMIIDIMLDEVNSMLEQKNIKLTCNEKVKNFIIDKGFDAKTGARFLRKIIQSEIEDRITDDLLRGKYADGGKIKAFLKSNIIYFKKDDSSDNTDPENHSGQEDSGKKLVEHKV